VANALLLVPPFLKIAYGPLLGPAMLVGAALGGGHDVQVNDLNAAWIRERLEVTSEVRRFVGDHDRPAALTNMHREFVANAHLHVTRDTHEAVFTAAKRLADGAFGAWVCEKLDCGSRPPDVVGVSVMYRDQVEPALAMTMIARRRWPGALVVWGGAHVTALRDEIAGDGRYGGDGLIERFVFGYAEQTWRAMLDAVAHREPFPSEAIRAGDGRWLRAVGDLSVVPVFHDLPSYAKASLTLPVQSSRGCTYGACAYCTYPNIEGDPCELPWSAIDPVIELAIEHGAALSFKDSLVEGKRLEAFAERIGGRVQWSACTKLDARLPGRLSHLAVGGCKTLEIGLETLDLAAQGLIKKRQSEATWLAFLDAAAAAGVAVIANYITGLPGIDRGDEIQSRAAAERALMARRPALVSKLEHNTFQLERLAPMAREPARFGLHITERSPWSSVLKSTTRPRLIQIRKRA
jgi:hypothetical protein